MTTKPIINGFNTLAPLLIQNYESYLPTAFDENLSLLQKVNKLIQYCNDLGKLNSDIVSQWNTVMDWVMNDGLTEDVSNKLDEMVASGLFNDLIEGSVFTDFNNRLNGITKNNGVFISEEAGVDLTGVNPSSSALTSALTKGGIIQLPEICTLVIDKTFLLSGAQEIHGRGRDSVIKLRGDFTLFDIQSSAVVLKNLRIIVPDSNTKPVIKVTPQPNKAIKYCDLDIWIETETSQGNWTGLQWDLTVGFLLYRNKFKVNMQYPKIGLDVIGNGGATGNDCDLEIAGFETALNLNGSDSFQNNRFSGELEDYRTVTTKGVYMVRGWGNRFDFNCWYDSETGTFYPYWFESATFDNVVKGHMEGRYVDSGDNLFDATFYKWDFSTVPRSQAGLADYRDTLNNQLPAPVNLLKNASFSIGNNAGWTGFDGRVTMDRDSATFGYTTMKLTSTSTTIGWGSQMVDDWEQYKGKTLYAGCWVFISSNSTGDRVAGISISDGVSASYSDLAIKNGNWHWLTVKRTIDPNATYVSIELGRVNSALGKVSTVGDVVYCTKPVLMMGGKLRPQTHIPQKRLLKYTPVSGNTGKLGDECIDDNYYYVWTADNTVKRVALTSF